MATSPAPDHRPSVLAFLAGVVLALAALAWGLARFFHPYAHLTRRSP